MDIRKASSDDLDRVLSLVSEVSTVDILPLFN